MARLRSRDLFPTDAPIAADRMIGRAEDVEELARMLMNGMHRVIAAPRRTGKTSVCEAAIAQARESGSYVVAVDLFELADAAELAEALVAATVSNRPGLRRAMLKARETGGSITRALGKGLGMTLTTELGQEVEIAFRPGFSARDPERYLAYALGLLQGIAAADDRQLILFIDEFQEIANPREPYGDDDALTKRMRAILQRSDRVTCLFAGSVEHLMRDLFAPRQRAFYQFGGFHELGPIGKEDWVQGIAGRLAEDGCSIDDVALDRLIELGEGHPRATMLIAQHAHAWTVTLEVRMVDSMMVTRGFEDAMASDRLDHERVLERIRQIRGGLATAKRIAHEESTYRNLDRGVRDRAVRALLNAGIVERPARGHLRIADPLLRRYLQELDTLT